MFTYCEPWPEKRNIRRSVSRISGDEFFTVVTVERGNGFARVFDYDGAAMRKCLAAKLAGEGNVSQIQFGMLCQMRGEIRKGLIRGGFGLCGNREHLLGLWRAR